MNPTTPNHETDEIRSEIDTTRRRMDDTIGAIGDRLQGRHLIDEALGFFRNNPDRSRELGQKVSQTATSAMHSFTDTVKANPIPALLIGAGVGWMIYQSRRSSSSDGYGYEYDYESADRSARGSSHSDTDTLYDRPLDYPASATTQDTDSLDDSSYNVDGLSAAAASSKLGQAKDTVVGKASAATNQVKQRISDVSSRLRDRSQAVGQQARELGSRVQERARETYERSRARVTSTAREHPLELGLACLAIGIIAGLAVRTPERLDRAIGPAVDRLRDRTREAGSALLQKGQRVAHAAAEAAKDEAKAQGLAPEPDTESQPQAAPSAT